MPMNREVFLSLLALDAYNRGYGENVGGLETPTLDADGNPVEDIRLGRAQIISDSEAVLGPNAQAAGFYAIAYDWNGERVISFRGTNFVSDISDIPQLLGTYADISEGWSIFTGWGGSRNAAGLPAG